jgi:hypothetical protein
MSSKTTKVMAIRVKNETAEYFHDKPLNRIVESVHDLAKREEIKIEKGEVVIVAQSKDRVIQ